MFKTWCLSLRYICFICVFLYVKEKQDSDDFSSYGINMNQWSCGVVACRWLVGQLGLGTNLLMAIFGGQSWNHFPVIPPQKKPVALWRKMLHFIGSQQIIKKNKEKTNKKQTKKTNQKKKQSRKTNKKQKKPNKKQKKQQHKQTNQKKTINTYKGNRKLSSNLCFPRSIPG